MLDWNSLHFFLELARAGRLDLAAKRLGVNRTTVARHVAGLETEVGGRLFHRDAKGYELTEIGTRFLACAERIEEDLSELEPSALGGQQNVVGKIRIGTTEGFGCMFIAPNLVELYRRHPDLEVELLAIPGFVDIFKRQADMSITLERPTHGRLIIEKLTDYYLRLYASRDYIENHPRITSTKDLADHCLIGYIKDLMFSKQLFYLDDAVPAAHPKITSTSIVAQYKLVASGVGLAILPSLIARREPDLEVVLPEVVKIKRTFWLVTPSDLRHLPHIRVVRDFLKELVITNRDLVM
jgi:DNA-binding transcriptional LysR family regulator